MSWADSHKDAPLGTHIFVAVCIFVLAILVAYGAYRLYDLPVREWLKKKLFKSAIKREESDARINSSEREQTRPEVKSAIKREESDARINSSEREQTRPEVKSAAK